MVKHSAARKVKTGILIFIAFCSITFGISSVTLRGIFADRTMTDIVSSIDVDSGKTTIDEWVYLYLETGYPDYLSEFGISQGAVSYILDHTAFAVFLSNKLMDYTHDILSHTGTGKMTSDEFMDFIEENRDVVEYATGRYYEDGEFPLIRDYIRTMLMFEDISLKSICTKIGIPLDFLRFFVSIPFGIGSLFVFLASLIGIYVMNRKKKPYLALACAGVDFLILGVIYTVVVSTFAPVIEEVAYRIQMGASLVGSIVEPVRRIFRTVCIASYSIAAVLIIGCLIMHLLLRAKKPSEKSEQLIVGQEESA